MQEPMNKALLLINLILKVHHEGSQRKLTCGDPCVLMTDLLRTETSSLQEEKYRRQVSESPNFISRLLTLLEKPGAPETKILFLRIVATIGESDRNKIEIGMSFGCM